MSQEEFESRARCCWGRTQAAPSSVHCIGLFLLAVLLTGCNGSPKVANADPYQLATAKYADCQQQGEAMARYLDTGQHTLYDSFGWSDQRQTAISLTGNSRSLYIRQQANAAIDQCDTNEAQQKAVEPPSEQQAQAALQVKEQATCENITATWRWGVCYIAYISPNDGETYYYTITFDANGNVAPGPGPQNAAECSTYANIATLWHPDTDICSL